MKYSGACQLKTQIRRPPATSHLRECKLILSTYSQLSRKAFASDKIVH